MSGKERAKTGRPNKLVVSEELLKQIEGLARIQCTQREAAAVLRVDRDTFGGFLRTNEKARQAWDEGLEAGKASLRRLQFKNAENGNATMQIWLGKQWIDQKDKTENTVDVGATLGGLLGKLTGAVVPEHSSAAEHENAIPESVADTRADTFLSGIKFQN